MGGTQSTVKGLLRGSGRGAQPMGLQPINLGVGRPADTVSLPTFADVIRRYVVPTTALSGGSFLTAISYPATCSMHVAVL